MNSINEDLKSRHFRQIYLLYGEEAYLVQQYKHKLLEALCEEGDTMNFARFEGKDISQQEVIDLAETMPFFSDRRVILLEDTGFFKNKCDLIADYMTELPDYLNLIFVEQEVDKRSRMYKAVRDKGHAAEFKMPKNEDLVKWIGGTLKNNGRKIRTDTAELLLERTGSDMGNIRNELEKLICYTEGRDHITTADLDAVCITQTVSKIFDMVRAVVQKDQKQAMALYEDLLALREPPLKILAIMARQFRQMLLAKRMEHEGTAQPEMMKVLGVQYSSTVRSILSCARRYTFSELEGILREFTEMEESVKTGKIGERLAVELMIIRCLEPGQKKKAAT